MELYADGMGANLRHYNVMKSGFDLYYPRSFLKLLLLALGLVALPLILALVGASVFVEDLAEQSRSMVGEAAQAARGSRQMMEQVTAMERAARQYLILDDPALITDYESVRAAFRKTASELSLLPLDETQLQALNRTIDKEAELYATLKGDLGKAADRASLVEGYANLAGLAQGVVDISNAVIDGEVDTLRETSLHAQNLLWWRLSIAVAAGVLMALGVSWLVAKPIRQIDRAIRSLGGGHFDHTIRISGPEDLVYLGDRLEWLRQRLLELENQKRLFMRHVSHELKTPLTSLREGAELLADGTAGSLSPAQTDIVAILKKQGTQLQRLIENLLDYQRVQDGMGRHDTAAVELDGVVEQVIEAHRLEAGARHIRFDARLAHETLQGDREKLRVIVDNLLSNAVKYSPDGAAVSCLLARTGDALQLDVIDAGPGVPEADRDKIFDWFFRGEYGHHGRLQGSGLGLAIARDFVLAHEGSITVTDAPGGGAHFQVVFPLQTTAAATGAQAHTA